MVDNFDLIKPLLDIPEQRTDTGQDFYFVQVIQRKKDHKEENKRLGRNNNARLVKAYYIYSKEQFDEYKEEMIALAKLFNARVGINLNRRNSRKLALEMNEQLAACLKSENYNLSKLYNSCCGMVTGGDKLWLVDIDIKDLDIVEKMCDYINDLEPVKVTNKIVATIPTKSGYHLVTTAFNSKVFSETFPGIEVHKNNPTVLYIPDTNAKSNDLKVLLDKLYTECAHGEQEHREWLQKKFDEFLSNQ